MADFRYGVSLARARARPTAAPPVATRPDPAPPATSRPRGAGVRVGVLALQGDFAAHVARLTALGATVQEIRRPGQLDSLDGLVIPGGESTTLLKLMEGTGFEDAITAFHRRGGALFGTCAGLILLARGVSHPAQRSLGLIDVDVERNSYGRQIDSFEALADGHGLGGAPLPLVFIRAPRLTRLGPGVEPLATCRGDVVLARQESIMVASFHPELTTDERVHRRFLDLAGAVPGLATLAAQEESR